MFSSDRNNKSSGRKSFWPFGRKKKKDSESSSDENIITETADNTTTESVNTDSQQATTSVEPDENQLAKQSQLKDEISAGDNSSDESSEITASSTTPEAGRKKSPGFLSRIYSGLKKTRNSFVNGIENLLFGKKQIDDELLEELEMQLITADIGVEATTDIIQNLTEQLQRKELKDSHSVITSLKKELLSIIEPCSKPLVIDQTKKPFVILVVGVNGVGKTTTIGKLARQFHQQNKSVMLAAGDTFRAAAIEQLQTWGERNKIPVIAQHHGADSASVIFDAYESAKEKNYDVLIADTAGRLHNKENLMHELTKIKRILTRMDNTSPHEIMLILDAGTGQNAMSQATLFHEAVQLTGITFTKLDGTAKGGVVFALAKKLQLPVRYLGVGEQVDDLQPFSAKTFVDALFTGNLQPNHEHVDN